MLEGIAFLAITTAVITSAFVARAEAERARQGGRGRAARRGPAREARSPAEPDRGHAARPEPRADRGARRLDSPDAARPPPARRALGVLADARARRRDRVPDEQARADPARLPRRRAASRRSTIGSLVVFSLDDTSIGSSSTGSSTSAVLDFVIAGFAFLCAWILAHRPEKPKKPPSAKKQRARREDEERRSSAAHRSRSSPGSCSTSSPASSRSSRSRTSPAPGYSARRGRRDAVRLLRDHVQPDRAADRRLRLRRRLDRHAGRALQHLADEQPHAGSRSGCSSAAAATWPAAASTPSSPERRASRPGRGCGPRPPGASFAARSRNSVSG